MHRTNQELPRSRRDDVRRRHRRLVRSVAAVASLSLVAAVGLVSDMESSPARAAIVDGTPVEEWLSTADGQQRLQQQADGAFSATTPPQGQVIDVDPAVAFQPIDGFGASLTDASAWLIANKLSQPEQDELMSKLFSPTDGIGLSMLRQPMGGSDFDMGHYTYDDMPAGQTDPDLSNFSIDHDRSYILPLLQQARSLNPGLSVMASPWSAPAWMKTSDSLIGGGLRGDAMSAYADYFTRFVQDYEAAGVPIRYVTSQNEPLFEPADYPGMSLTAPYEAELIRDHLAPAFREAGVSTQILAYDHNWDRADHPLAILDDPAARDAVAGTAFHCYGGDVSAQTQVHDAHPDKGIWLTECSDGTWQPTDYASVLQRNLGEVIDGTRNWSRSIIKWNLALDENHNPHNGGCGTCDGTVLVRSDGSGVEYGGQYTALGHARSSSCPAPTGWPRAAPVR